MRLFYAITLVLGTCLLSSGQTTSSTRSSDQAFLRNAAEGGIAEVEFGQLAEKNASTPVVKQFGQRMVTDHTKLNEQVKSLAGTKGVTLSSKLSAKDMATYRSLSAKTGSDFDKAYISMMVKDHTHDISEFQREANSGSDPDVKAAASQALPILQEHLRMAEDAAKQLGISPSTGGDLR